MSNFRCSDKQVEIMRILMRATGEGEALHHRQLKERLSYGKNVSDIAVFISVKFLVKHGLVLKERMGRYVYLHPTNLGYKIMSLVI